jgi:flagellar hook-basal body complex protein FliE
MTVVVPVGGVSSAGLDQLAAALRQQVVSGTDPTSGTSAGTASDAAAAARGADFGGLVKGGLQNLENLDRTAQTKAIEAATGDLTDVHDYVIAATQAQVATELTTTIRNKALDAFNEIMRMPL